MRHVFVCQTLAHALVHAHTLAHTFSVVYVIGGALRWQRHDVVLLWRPAEDNVPDVASADFYFVSRREADGSYTALGQ